MTDDERDRRIERLEREAEGFRAALADLRAGRLNRSDREVLEAVLPALGGAYGGELLTSSEICASSRPGVAFVVRLHALTPRRLGKLLSKADGIPVGGHVVEALGHDGGVRLWKVQGFEEA